MAMLVIGCAKAAFFRLLQLASSVQWLFNHDCPLSVHGNGIRSMKAANDCESLAALINLQQWERSKTEAQTSAREWKEEDDEEEKQVETDE